MDERTGETAERIIALLGDCIISARLLDVCIKDIGRAEICARWALQARHNSRPKIGTPQDIDEKIKHFVECYYLCDLIKNQRRKGEYCSEIERELTESSRNPAKLTSECLIGLAYIRLNIGRETQFDKILDIDELVSQVIRFKKDRTIINYRTRREIEAILADRYNDETSIDLWNSWWPVLISRLGDTGAINV